MNSYVAEKIEFAEAIAGTEYLSGIYILNN